MASVLIVEDNLSTLRLFSKALLNKGRHTVTTATTLQEAECVLSENRFHAVVLDLEMPDGTGLDLFQVHAGVFKLHNTVVVAVSAGEEYAAMCRTSGIEHFFLKPILPSSLANIVSELIDFGNSQ